jgi:hypothetical protein
VADWYGAQYDWTLQNGVRHPIGPPFGEEHVVRVGDWGADTSNHFNNRNFLETTSVNFLGFNCATTPRVMSC